MRENPGKVPVADHSTMWMTTQPSALNGIPDPAAFTGRIVDPVLHLHCLAQHQVAVPQDSASVADLGRGHVALEQEVTAQAVGSLAGVDSVVLLLGCRNHRKLPALPVLCKIEAERFENAVRKTFTVFEQEMQRREAEWQRTQGLKQLKKPD
jgi:hypothetical protein